MKIMKTGKLIQKIGAAGEERARWFFNEIGAKCVEKIPTPARNINGRMVYCSKSSVDFTMALPTRGCIFAYMPCRVEVKVCDDDKLPHSRLSDHQVKWLTEWSELGFWSFVVWVHKSECIMFRYPNKYFERGKSIPIDVASKIKYC